MSVLMAEADTQLAAELWLSFRSVLRSYAAAAHLRSEEIARVEWSESDIALVSAAARLALKFDLASGRGSWHLYIRDQESAQGRFNLLPEGALELDGRVLDLDHAAIDLVGLVTNPRNVSGHGFSRADQAPGKEGASAPEGSSSKPHGEVR